MTDQRSNAVLAAGQVCLIPLGASQNLDFLYLLISCLLHARATCLHFALSLTQFGHFFSSAKRSNWVEEPNEREANSPASEVARTSSPESAGGKKWKAGNVSNYWINKEDEVGANVKPPPRGSMAIVVPDVDTPLNMLMSRDEIEELCVAIPKVELHAHLSGTVLESTLRGLLVAQGGEVLLSL